MIALHILAGIGVGAILYAIKRIVRLARLSPLAKPGRHWTREEKP
jgi:hypothetical protein